MKLCHCNWMPSSVANWLSSSLEAKGIPSFYHTPTLLTILHPRFCVAKLCAPVESVGNEEAVHPDADFPLIPQNLFKNSEIEESSLPNDLSIDQKWKNKALVYLLSAYNHPEELKILVEELFDQLEQSKLEQDSRREIIPLDQESKSEGNTESPVTGVKFKNTTELNNNEDNENSQLKKLVAKDSIMDKDPNIMLDNMGLLEEQFSTAKQKSEDSKEGWEIVPALCEDSSNISHRELQGNRLFERTANIWGEKMPPDEHGLEPWETDTVWPNSKDSKSLEDIYTSVAYSSLEFANENAVLTESSMTPQADTNSSVFDPWSIGLVSESERVFKGASNVRSQWPTQLPPTNLEKPNNVMQEELVKSFQQLGFQNLWNNEANLTDNPIAVEHLRLTGPMEKKIESMGHFDEVPHDVTGNLRIRMPVVSPMLTNIHYGPNGPCAELNHTETSGFSSVVPRKSVTLTSEYAKKSLSPKVVDPFVYSDSSQDDENLLTSPRTHFRPIRHDSNNTPVEEDDHSEEALEPHFKESDLSDPTEIVFHRSESGNLFLENDGLQGSPKKYMIYKELVSGHASSVSPELNLHHHPRSSVHESPGFIPKFQVVNNEKYSQTDDEHNQLESKSHIYRSDEAWTSEMPRQLKKLWEEPEDCSVKEAWEMDFDAFTRIKEKWSDASFVVEDDQTFHGSELMSQVWKQSPLKKMPRDETSETAKIFPGLLKRFLGEEQDDSKLWSPKEFVPRSQFGPGNVSGSSRWFDWSNEQKGFLDKSLDGDEQIPDAKSPEGNHIDDLDTLGFEFNDGFEWDHPNEDEVDEENSQEVLVCETEDGQTIYLPVEYLDSDLYDKLFDTDSDEPIGGSLPTLPPGQLEQWKKKLSLKIAKRGRSGKSLPASKRPCSFFLEGNCRRTDCKFSHDLSSITCRFWEEGSCFKGDACPFYHGYTINTRRRNRSEGDQSTEPIDILDQGRLMGKRGRKPHSFEINSEADFPTLGSSYESRSNSTEELAAVEISSKSTKPKKKKKSSKTKKEPNNGMDPNEGGSGFDIPQAVNVNTRKAKRSKETRRVPVTLKKVLKSHQDLINKQYCFHEDGTVSDF